MIAPILKPHTHHICHAKNYIYTTVDGKYRCGKPLMSRALCRSNFHAAWHVEALHKSHCIEVHILLPCATWQGCILLHSATRYSMDAPLCCVLTTSCPAKLVEQLKYPCVEHKPSSFFMSNEVRRLSHPVRLNV